VGGVGAREADGGKVSLWDAGGGVLDGLGEGGKEYGDGGEGVVTYVEIQYLAPLSSAIALL
jgi:hypothetical protein